MIKIVFFLLICSIIATLVNIFRKNGRDPKERTELIKFFATTSVILFFGIGIVDSCSSKNYTNTHTNSEKSSSIESEDDKKEKINDQASEEKDDDAKVKIIHGELLDLHEDTENSKIVIKAKINPNMTNKMTIQQNGYNIEDIILNQGGDKYSEIQYWAVSDMSDGSEGKVISFTVDKDLITAVKNKNVFGNQIIDKVKDLWILPSLKS